MKVQFVRRSPMSGKESSMIFEVDEHKLDQWENRNMPIQNAFPHLSPSEREFIMTGFTIDEQKQIFGE